MINLPDVNFIDADAQAIISDFVQRYEFIAGRTLQKSDPIYDFILTVAYEKVNMMQQFELGLRGNLLAYAKGVELDHLASFRQLQREGESPDFTTLRWTLSAPQNSVITIPQGTRATRDNIVFFATTETVEIAAGQTFVDVEASSTTYNALASGIDVGLITNIVDPIPYVASVSNVTKTQGGRPQETDEELRERVYEAPSAYSTAGAQEAYEFLAKSANISISEVSVFSPTPGTVKVLPMLLNGELPTQTILDQVSDALTPKDKRPLTDYVLVEAPQTVEYQLNVTYWVDRADQARLVAIQSSINQAIDEWVLWQRQKIGRDINPTQLIKRMAAAGAKRVEVASPIFKKLELDQVAVNSLKTVNYGGLEDE